MAHSNQTKFTAMMRYAAGETQEVIATSMGIDAATVSRWRTASDPQDWEAERRKIENAAAQKISAKLIEKKKNLGTSHFETLELLHRAVKMSLLRKKIDPL